jgi:glycosyltransferase involved in cell wall biosynthesis
MMDIVFFGIYSNDKFVDKVIKKSRSPFSIAQFKMEKGLIRGLIASDAKINRAFCMPCLPYHTLNKNVFAKSFDVSDNFIKIETLPVINIPLVGKISISFLIFLKLLFTKKNSFGPNPVFMITLNYLPVVVPLLIVSKIKKIKTVIMLTDCARNTFSLRVSIEKNTLKKLFNIFKKKIAEFFEKRYDGYILLTTHMNQFVNTKKKPYTIIESIYDSNQHSSIEVNNMDSSQLPNNRKIILYSGSLFKIYGLDKIIDVMKYVDNDIELHIYGDGKYKNEVLKEQAKDSRIKYCGFVDQDTLKIKMNSAKLLINLRNPLLEFTKLSFPSKMLDYMMSETPVLTTRLQGIPDEYYNYVFYTISYDSKEIGQLISEICNLPSEEIKKITNRAREFILTKKNQDVQGKKIKEFLESLEFRNERINNL